MEEVAATIGGHCALRQEAHRALSARLSPSGRSGSRRLNSRDGRAGTVASATRQRASKVARESDGRDYKFTDPRTGEAPAVSRGRNMRSRCRCSMCPAIHINSRSWLRSSSTHEPSDPPHRVVNIVFASSPMPSQQQLGFAAQY